MEKEFVPYMIAFDMMAIGFKESCIATIDQTDYLHIKGTKSLPRGSMMYDTIDCPTFSQCFRWFRENYGYLPNIHNFNRNFKATLSGNCNWLGSWTKTYEEAEIECLKKLIEIVKEKK